MFKVKFSELSGQASAAYNHAKAEYSEEEFDALVDEWVQAIAMARKSDVTIDEESAGMLKFYKKFTEQLDKLVSSPSRHCPAQLIVPLRSMILPLRRVSRPSH